MGARGQQTGGDSEGADGVFMWGDVVDHEIVVDLVGFIQQSRRSVVLTLAHGALRKSVYFRQGAIIAASSSLPEDRFGDIMFRRGMITRAQLDSALAEVSPGRKIGNILMARGLISSEALWKVLKVQIEEILYSVLLFDSGEFTVAEYDAGQVPTRTALDTQHVLLEGLRRKDELQHLRGELPQDEERLVTTRAVADTELDPGEQIMFSLIDGRRTVQRLLEDCGLGAFGATRALHRLIKSGLVRRARGPGESHDERPLVILDAFNRAFARIQGALADRSETATIRSGFEAFFVDAGDPLRTLFAGVTMDAAGHMDVTEVLRNLAGCDARNRNQLLGWGLRDYLRYLLFAARETLPYDQVEALAAEVSQMVDGV